MNDLNKLRGLGYQVIFNAIAEATNVVADGRISISVEKFLDALPPISETEQQPSPTQQILNRIFEECRYWQGRDEARRGGFAILYADVKGIVDSAAIKQTEQPLQSDLPYVDFELALQKAFELGGLECGSYHLEADELCDVIRASLIVEGNDQSIQELTNDD